jgi:hypothetical protein
MITLSFKMPTPQEQTTQLFVIAMYYWFNGDRLNAESAMSVIMHTLPTTLKDISVRSN